MSYKKLNGVNVSLLILYEDDILRMGNDVRMLSPANTWLSCQLSMKDMEEVNYVFSDIHLATKK